MGEAERTLWTGAELSAALGLDRNRALDDGLAITEVAIRVSDSMAGTLFLPLTGHWKKTGASAREVPLVERAVKNRVTLALTTADRSAFDSRWPVVHVPKLTDALQALADCARRRFSGRVVAVTGSVGKTTTKDMVHHVLRHFGRAKATIENLSGVFDLYATLANLPQDFDYATIELGSLRPGRINMKAPTVRPNVGLLTNVGMSHAMNYANPYEIVREKACLFDHLVGDRVGIVCQSVLDRDDAREGLIRSKPLSRIVTVGDGSDSDLHLVSIDVHAERVKGVMSVFGAHHAFCLPVLGHHMAVNAMFAVAAASVFGIKPEDALEALSGFAASPQRMQRSMLSVGGGSIEVIDDCYNASPASVRALLSYLGHRTCEGRKVFVLGDMLELGPDEEKQHGDLAPDIEATGIDVLVAVGPLAHAAASKVSKGGAMRVLTYEDAEEASKKVPALLQSDDLIAIKGSRKMGLERIVETIAARAASDDEFSLPDRLRRGLRGFRRLFDGL